MAGLATPNRLGWPARDGARPRYDIAASWGGTVIVQGSHGANEVEQRPNKTLKRRMDQINDFVDERQKAWCIQCGERLKGRWTPTGTTCRPRLSCAGPTRRTFPSSTPASPATMRFSADEEYLRLFLQCVLAGFTDPEHSAVARDQLDPAVARGCQGRARVTAAQETAREDRAIKEGVPDDWR